MATTIFVRDIAQYDGQEVTVRGWVKAKTGKGKLQFIRLRDGTGEVQCVAFMKEMDEADFEAIRGLTQESSVIITGNIRADERAPGYPGGFEIGVTGIEVVQVSDEYPITPKEHGTE
ncbi:MAG: hypothetical protein KC413_05165, partial [Anaerolineales bacterium]|nr:hypothetical protein [Anaerolineales bacterium]